MTDDDSIIIPTEEFATPEVHASILMELGRLTTCWGWLEATIENMMAGLLGTEPQLLYPITADLAIGTRIKHLGLLAKLRIGEPIDLERLEIILSSLNVLCGRRNALIHGLWYRAMGDTEVAVVLETRPNRNAKTRKTGMYANAHYIEWLVDDVGHHTETLHKFALRYDLIQRP
jgi:hypothetical protein